MVRTPAFLVTEAAEYRNGKEHVVSTSLSQGLPEALRSIQTRPLFVLREQVPPLLVIGQTPNAFRRIGVIQGGSLEGERLWGEVVSGNDWQSVRTDSCIKLDVRLVLGTTDGALIVMTYQCLRAGPPSVLERLDKREAVDPRSYYFRMNPLFETSAPGYDWINRIIAVGVATGCGTGRSIAFSRCFDRPARRFIPLGDICGFRLKWSRRMDGFRQQSNTVRSPWRNRRALQRTSARFLQSETFRR